MDRLKLNQLIFQLYSLRKTISTLKQQESELKNSIKKEMGDKSTYSFSDYVLELKPKTYKRLKSPNSLPDEYFISTTYRQIHIKRKQDIELIGNKFVSK